MKTLSKLREDLREWEVQPLLGTWQYGASGSQYVLEQTDGKLMFREGPKHGTLHFDSGWWLGGGGRNDKGEDEGSIWMSPAAFGSRDHKGIVSYFKDPGSDSWGPATIGIRVGTPATG